MKSVFEKALLSLAVAVVAAVHTLTASAEVDLVKGTAKSRHGSAGIPGFPWSASGITYAGGNTYYVVADDNTPTADVPKHKRIEPSVPREVGLYKVQIEFSGDGKSILSCACGPRVALEGATDLEAVAYDPASGNVWAADEQRKTIREYDVLTGAVVSSLDIPPVMMQTRGNLGFESLTISGDGLTMWTANEESLVCDGPHSSYYESATNRLVKFTRKTVHDRWQLAAMYPYVTGKWDNNGSYHDQGRRGIADMCALPDGSVLVLEREYSGLLYFCAYVYRITTEALASATDVKAYSSLSGFEWDPVEKGATRHETEYGIWSGDTGGNYEGLCLGKRLSEDSCEVVILSDAMNGGLPYLTPNVLTGLNIHTVNFDFTSSIGKASPVGQNYRFVHGATANASVYGDGIEPRAYTNRGDIVSSATWSLPNHNPSSGNGASTSFTVLSDDTLTWNVWVAGCYGQWGESAPIFMHDTFEEHALGTKTSEMAGWIGEGEVVAKEYTPKQGSGKYVLKNSSPHTQVLDATEECAERSLSSIYVTPQDNTRMDMMFEVKRAAGDLRAPSGNARYAIAVDRNGRLQLWHLARVNDKLVRRWSQLSSTAYADGDWVRLGMELSYTSSRAYGRVRVNGTVCSVYGGNSTPALRTGGNGSGQWFPMPNASVPESVAVIDTKADDFVLATTSFMTQLDASQSIVVSPADAASPGSRTAVSGGVAYSVATAVAAPAAACSAGAPSSSTPAALPVITGFGLNGEGRPFVRFSGYVEGASYRVVCSSSVGFDTTRCEYPDGRISAAKDGVAVWEGREPCDPASGARFYKVELVRPEQENVSGNAQK
ncbi:MAG: esterase-like activity of phytase family protein [Kiritimatiellae bacterium]|nr:esterase-like activity of phytase family protein [Kiritimatiellia bacterium]